MLREMATTVAFKDRQPILVSPSALKRAGGASETTAQRRAIDAKLADGLADIEAGRTFGPFDTTAQMVAHMKRHVKRNAKTIGSKRQSARPRNEGRLLGTQNVST
jgi:predicted transcriptional regulator